jgi:hypothetical protein
MYSHAFYIVICLMLLNSIHSCSCNSTVSCAWIHVCFWVLPLCMGMQGAICRTHQHTSSPAVSCCLCQPPVARQPQHLDALTNAVNNTCLYTHTQGHTRLTSLQCSASQPPPPPGAGVAAYLTMIMYQRYQRTKAIMPAGLVAGVR